MGVLCLKLKDKGEVPLLRRHSSLPFFEFFLFKKKLKSISQKLPKVDGGEAAYLILFLQPVFMLIFPILPIQAPLTVKSI